MGRSGREGTVAQVVTMKGVFHSLTPPRLSPFQLFEASHQMGLNSRRDTICLSSTPASLFLGISPTHPSIFPSPSICFDSVLYLPAATGIHPPIHSPTMLLSDH